MSKTLAPQNPSSIEALLPASADFGEGRLAGLLTALASTAVERDRRGGHAAEERELIRASGLLAASIPRNYGGSGFDWPQIFSFVRRIAAVDGSLAHLFAFHHLQLATVLLYGNAAQQDHYLVRTLADKAFWGNALNPLDTRLKAVPSANGFILDGEKRFCSGARGSDYLLASAHLPDGKSYICAVLPTRQRGIVVHEDWDAFGQRQTDSGSASFEKVFVESEAVLSEPGPNGNTRATLRTCIAQLVLANLYTGIAAGALEQARSYVHQRARPWLTAEVETAAADPYIQHRFGEMRIAVNAAAALSDIAAERLQQAWERGSAITPEERGQCAIAIAEAKVFSARAGLDLATQIFDALGASATSARYGFDRFWRNLRTHSLHDPLDYKTREIGAFALSDTLPEPSSYS